MLALAFLILWPLAELFVAIQVAGAIGWLATLLLLVASIPVGIWAMRAEGREVWRRFAVAVDEGRAPTREVLDGALVLIGGCLMIIPGFITDAIGLLLLLPPTRALARHSVGRNMNSRVVVRVAGFGPARQSYDVDSTAQDVPPPTLKA
jgi:UPF0716 protein FxsA